MYLARTVQPLSRALGRTRMRSSMEATERWKGWQWRSNLRAMQQRLRIASSPSAFLLRWQQHNRPLVQRKPFNALVSTFLSKHLFIAATVTASNASVCQPLHTDSDFKAVFCENSPTVRFLQAVAFPLIGNVRHDFMHGLNKMEIHGADKVLDAGLHRLQGQPITQGRIQRFCQNGLTAGQGSGIRSEASNTARSTSASSPRRLLVAYRAEYLTSNCGQSFSALRFYSAAFSTQRGKQETTRRDLAAQDDDPFDPLTDRIPEKPVTFAEGASYTVAIFAGFAVAAAAAYAVFKELIFEPKEYKVFNKALDRVQNDNQVTVRIGLPVTGYGQDSRNRAARQRIPHRTWADEDGVERIEVQFFVRGPHGVGRVHSEMFKDKEDKQWKFTYLIVDILSPSPTRIMLESYVPT